MLTPVTTKPMTAEEFADWVQRPENAARWFELERGEVIELPAPTRPHGVVAVRVATILSRYVEDRGEWYVASNDSGVILERDPDTVRGPDVAVYNDAASFEELHPKYGEVPPLLAVEIVSPGDRPGKAMRKIKDYLRAGVGLVWQIDPETRNVTVYQPGREPSLVEQDQELSGEAILPGFTCLVGDFFRLRKKAEPPPP
jgi:Uma2 family endonuclease